VAENKPLPPLPPSDASSLQRNHYDNYYGIGARTFWSKSELSSNEIKPFEKCEHYLINVEDGVECKKCHLGWTGSLQARDGKLYINGKPIE